MERPEPQSGLHPDDERRRRELEQHAATYRQHEPRFPADAEVPSHPDVSPHRDAEQRVDAALADLYQTVSEIEQKFAHVLRPPTVEAVEAEGKELVVGQESPSVIFLEATGRSIQYQVRQLRKILGRADL